MATGPIWASLTYFNEPWDGNSMEENEFTVAISSRLVEDATDSTRSCRSQVGLWAFEKQWVLVSITSLWNTVDALLRCALIIPFKFTTPQTGTQHTDLRPHRTQSQFRSKQLWLRFRVYCCFTQVSFLMGNDSWPKPSLPHLQNKRRS